MTEIKPDETLDCLGFYCPVPIYQTRLKMDKMKVGEILEVLADDPAAEADIKSWARSTGQEIIDFKKDGSRLRFLIKKVRG